MKILKYGSGNNKLPTIEVSCTGNGISNQNPCGALLEINHLDIQSSVSKDYGGGSETYHYIVCPVCGAKTEIKVSNISERIKNMLNIKEDNNEY